MFEMTLRITDNTCLGDLRELIEAADRVGTLSDAAMIAHYDQHDELDGISIVAGAKHGG